MNFDKMTIGKRLGVLTSALTLFTCLMGGAGYWSIQQMKASILTLGEDTGPGLEFMGRIAEGIGSYRTEVWKHIAASDRKEMGEIEAQQEKTQQLVAKAFENYRNSITQEEDRKNYAVLDGRWKEYLDEWTNRVRPLSRLGTQKERTHDLARNTISVTAAKVKESTDMMLDWNARRGNEANENGKRAAARSLYVSMILALIAIFGGGAFSVLLVRNVTGTLRRAMAEMASGADQVASVAGQVSASSQTLAEGSSEQAASLEETSASGEEINAMARQNTHKTTSVAEMVAQSQKKYVETNASLDQMLVSMHGIKEQSGKISKIIKVIDEIAFQTNILALNAAVEAARAGEAGLGFAVVADEVRNLAQRCAKAAQDTAAMIEESIAKANDGDVRVGQVAIAIRTITEEAATIRTLIDEVNIGSEEQARGIEEISRSITQVDQVTQRNAATAEECAAAAEELNAQSATMKNIVKGLTALVG